MINLSLDELKLIAQIRNISDCENKSKEDLINSLSETKPKPKPQTPKPEPKPQTPKPDPKPQTPKPEPEIRVNKRKLKKLRKDFDELRHKFSKEEINEYRKAFYIAKNYKHLSESEIENINKNFNELKKVKGLKNFMVTLIVLIMKILIIMVIIMILLMLINTEKLGLLEHCLKSLIEIITNQ